LNARPSDAKELARCIELIFEDENTYQRFSQGAFEHYSTFFKTDHLVNDYLEIYNSL
jgi:glycosyltransferase involved in cell wall biosynthesis